MVLVSVVSFAGLIVSCNSNDDYCFESQNPLPDAVTRSANSTGNYVFLDIYGTKYNTFMLVSGNPGKEIGDTNPFQNYTKVDENGNSVMEMYADFDCYQLLEEKCCTLYFDKDGLMSCVGIPYPDGSGHVFEKIPIGGSLDIWASEEKYTMQDLYDHDGDVEFFTKVANSFKCCYKTTLRKQLYIDYDRIVENGWSVWPSD